MQEFLSDEGSAYFKVHANRPQTIAYALTDSPVGQLAWAVDRMHAWVQGPIEEALTRDQILTNVMFYWITGTAGSAARFYYENMHMAAEWGRAPSARRISSRDTLRACWRIANRGSHRPAHTCSPSSDSA